MVASIVIGVWACAAQGEIVLSDGTRHKGDIELPVLSLFVASMQRQVKVAPSRIVLLRTWVEKEELLRAWTFVEEGSPKKIFLDENYPLRNYATEIFQDDGQVLRGHVTAASFDVATTDEDLKFALRARHKGKPGQTLEDLVYVRELRFGTPPPAAALAHVEGAAPGAAGLCLVRAEGGSAFDVPVGSDGKFRGEGFITGTYRAVVRSPGVVALGLPGEAAKEAVRTEILAAVAGYREFFEEKKVLALAGDEVVWAFVGLARAGKTSAGGNTYVRYELWRLEKRTPRWEIQERVYLWREILAPGAAPAWPAATIVPALSKLEVKAPASTLDLRAALHELRKGGTKP